MSDNPELQRLRDYAQVTEDRYLRMKLFIEDPAALRAARTLRDDAEEAVRAYMHENTLG